jgi:outer membrane receptor protein involved in Fe transport
MAACTSLRATTAYEIGYGFESHGKSYGVTAYYRLNRDSVTDVTEYLGNGLSLTTKTNLPRTDSAGLEFTSNGPIVPKRPRRDLTVLLWPSMWAPNEAVASTCQTSLDFSHDGFVGI